MKLAVAVSGGTDSLYALAALCEQGDPAQVIAVHALFHQNKSSTKQEVTEAGAEPEEHTAKALAARCRDLGAAFHLLDLQERFAEQVIKPFAEAYARGETPNPCAHCNRRIKFGLLLDEARKLGAEKLATGHYAALVTHPCYGLALRTGADSAKDQTYFLALTPLERLRAALFPLGELRKEDVRAWLAKRDIAVPLPKESQEICFVPDDDYRAFLQGSGVRLPAGGPMIVGDGLVVGHHQGLWQYTEGQRRGLGVAWAEPLYVIGKDRPRNALLLGTAAELRVGGCVAAGVNLLVPPERWPNDLFVRTRYRQTAQAADVRIQGQTPSSARMLVRFHQPQLPSAPGQIVAVFDAEGYLLAGAVIRKEG